MRWIAIAAGVLLVASLVGSEEQAAEEESPLIFTLEVNGEPHPIEPGKLLTLPAQEGLIKVRLKVAPYRVFRAPGVEFLCLVDPQFQAGAGTGEAKRSPSQK